MTQTINYLIALVGLLALLNVGSLALWRAMKLAVKPVPQDLASRSRILILMAGVTACIVLLLAAWLLWKLVQVCLS